MPDKNTFYKKKIIRELYFGETLSNSEISDRIQMSIPSSTKILNELIDEKLITDAGYAPSSGGRRPLLYSLHPDSMYVVGVAMEQLFTRIAILDMRRNKVTEMEKFDLHMPGNPGAVDELVEIIRKHI
jgi:hypothetical protein